MSGDFGASYSDENLTIYSQQSDGTFASSPSDEIGDSIAKHDLEIGESELGDSASVEEIEQLFAIREIEKSVDYKALGYTDAHYEELYKYMSDKDKHIVVGLSEWMQAHGVIEKKDIEAHVEEEEFSEVMDSATSAAMKDSEVNPDAYSDDSIIEGAIAEHEHSADTAGANPMDEFDTEDAKYWASKEETDKGEPKEESSSVSTFLNYGFSDDGYRTASVDTREIVSPLARLHGASAQDIVSKADEIIEKYEHIDEKDEKETRLSVDDISLIKKLLDQNKLTDEDIADIVEDASVEDVSKLREIL